MRHLSYIFRNFIELSILLINANSSTMKKYLTDNITAEYESPKFDILAIDIEGVQCSSLEQLQEYDDVFEW